MRSTAILATIFSIAACLHGAPGLSGDAKRGAKLFTELQCASCHGPEGSGGKSAPGLGKRAGQVYTPNAMAGAMWSHATTMWQAMDQAGIRRPQLTASQAADIYAFLAGAPHPDKPGNAQRGGQIFQAKLCASCHDQSMMGAPNLAAQAGRFSAFSMVAALWQHGAGMLSRMVARNTAWQTLSPEEIGDVIAYLNGRK